MERQSKDTRAIVRPDPLDIVSSPDTLHRTHLRGIFWTIVPFPTIINRYNIWVGLVTEILSAVSAVYAANFALQNLFSSQLAGVLGHAISHIAFSDRAFELNPPPVPPA